MKRDDMEKMKHVLIGIHSFGDEGKCGFRFTFMEKINNAYNMDWIKSHLELTWYGGILGSIWMQGNLTYLESWKLFNYIRNFDNYLKYFEHVK